MPKFKRHVSLVMAIMMILIYAPLPTALAAMIPTDATVVTESSDAQRDKVKAFLQRTDVVEMLEARGIDPNEAANRVSSLTDSEVDLLARNIDTLPAGGGFLGTVALIGLIFFLVLIVLDLTGVTDVFTFINSPR